MKPRTLLELRDVLFSLQEVAEAEIEGEEPARLRVDVSGDIDYVIAYCSMLDWKADRRGKLPVLIFEDA